MASGWERMGTSTPSGGGTAAGRGGRLGCVPTWPAPLRGRPASIVAPATEPSHFPHTNSRARRRFPVAGRQPNRQSRRNGARGRTMNRPTTGTLTPRGSRRGSGQCGQIPPPRLAGLAQIPPPRLAGFAQIPPSRLAGLAQGIERACTAINWRDANVTRMRVNRAGPPGCCLQAANQ
jgi:hypothetical protein